MMIHDGEKPKCGMSENVVDLQNDYSNGKDDDRDWWMWGYPIFRKKNSHVFFAYNALPQFVG
jgi:hypothetical protein